MGVGELSGKLCQFRGLEPFFEQYNSGIPYSPYSFRVRIRVRITIRILGLGLGIRVGSRPGGYSALSWVRICSPKF